MTKTLKTTLFLMLLFQFGISTGLELAHDEAYYWLFSRHLDWGYFDHPPFMAVVIKLFSFLPHSEFSVRLGFILLQFGSLFILLSMTSYSMISLLLFFSFPLASFTGLFALPDIPLLFMTACYCYQLKKYLEVDSARHSLGLGLIIALLFYAKYHGVLLIFFTIIALPGLLKRKSFYLVTLTALILFMPHISWQYRHDFSTLRYHFLERPSSLFSLERSVEFIALQIALAGLFVGPIVWYLILKLKTQNNFDRAMKFISVGTVIFFLISTFTKKFEANWTIFLAIPLIYLTSNSLVWKKKWVKALLGVSFSIALLARILLVLPPEEVGIRRLKEFHGWEIWARNIREICGEDIIMANSYQIASKLSFYLNQEVTAFNYRSRKNQFDHWRWDRNYQTKKLCYITDKSEFTGLTLKTPDGKSLQVVKNESIERLWALKSNQR